MARKFEDCKSRLLLSLQTYPKNKQAKTTLLKVYLRLQEGQTGKYNFEEMIKLTLNKQIPVKLDCADFVGPVSLENTIDSGRGLFATRDVKFGELLLASKAFHVCYPETDGASIIIDLTKNHIQRSSGSQLISGIVQKLFNNPSTSKEFLKLFSGNYERVQQNIIDGRPVVDTYVLNSAGLYTANAHPSVPDFLPTKLEIIILSAAQPLAQPPSTQGVTHLKTALVLASGSCHPL